VKRFAVLLSLFFPLLGLLLCAQENPRARQSGSHQSDELQSAGSLARKGQILVVIPFENMSPTPGLEWLGEAFPLTLRQQLDSPLLYVASREERLRAYERQGVPVGVHPSRATIYRLAEQMDVDYAVLGSYRYDGAHLTAVAQLLDMRTPRLLPAVNESASLDDYGNLQSALAWDLLHQIRSDFPVAKNTYVTGIPPIRLDALENYIRGTLATTGDERIRCLREATRISPSYTQAWLELGKSYYAEHSYELATAALSQVPPSAPVARESNFYLGLAAYAQGDLVRAQNAFSFVAARLPLAEVYNNLGVVASHREPRKAAEYFERAIEDDPSDADYRYNLGVNLVQTGDHAGAVRALRTALDLRPNDAEARAYLETIAPSSGKVVATGEVSKAPSERIKRNYEEDAFRQMTMQMGTWAEQRFARSDPRAHARFHVELGKELLDHGFASEAEEEFRHAAAVDPSSSAPLTALAEDYEARGDAQQARAQAEAALRVRESADAYLVLARLDLRENRMDQAAQNIQSALQLEPSNAAGQDLKRTLAARLAEKAQPLSQP